MDLVSQERGNFSDHPVHRTVSSGLMDSDFGQFLVENSMKFVVVLGDFLCYLR